MDEPPENAALFGGQQISQDLLNKIAASGMPPHKLTLKEGAPVMLLRHMHGVSGQANGTRLVAAASHILCFNDQRAQVHSRVVEAQIVTGCSIGKVVYIPRINSTNTDSPLPFKLSSGSFPSDQPLP